MKKLKHNLKTIKSCIGKSAHVKIVALGKLERELEGFEAKFTNFDGQKWFEENVYEDWTWEGMLEKFIKKEILAE